MPTRRSFLTTAATLSASILADGAEKGEAGRKLKYLQIGTGHAHADKLSAYAESPDWEVIGIVEEDEERLRAAQKTSLYGKFPFLSLADGLATRGLDVVGIETEVRDLLHYGQIAADAGFHLHLDKPAGSDLAAFKKLLETTDAKGRVVQMGYMYRYNPAVEMLRRFLKAGWLGEIFETEAVMSKVVPAVGRKALAEYPGGMMFELGCHLIDLTVGLLGCPERVTAYPRRSQTSAKDSLMDNMLAVLEYPKATATVRSTALEVEGFSRRHFSVCGTQGSFHIQPLDRPKVTISLDRPRQSESDGRVFPKGTSVIEFEPPYGRYVGDAADLARIVRGEKANPWPSSHDLCVQRTVLEASASESLTGK